MDCYLVVCQGVVYDCCITNLKPNVGVLNQIVFDRDICGSSGEYSARNYVVGYDDVSCSFADEYSIVNRVARNLGVENIV